MGKEGSRVSHFSFFFSFTCKWFELACILLCRNTVNVVIPVPRLYIKKKKKKKKKKKDLLTRDGLEHRGRRPRGMARNPRTESAQDQGRGGSLLLALEQLQRETRALFESFLRGEASRLLSSTLSGADGNTLISQQVVAAGLLSSSSSASQYGVDSSSSIPLGVCETTVNAVSTVVELLVVAESSMCVETEKDKKRGAEGDPHVVEDDPGDIDLDLLLTTLLQPLQHVLTDTAEQITSTSLANRAHLRDTPSGGGNDKSYQSTTNSMNMEMRSRGSIFLLNNLVYVRTTLSKRGGEVVAAWLSRLSLSLTQITSKITLIAARAFLMRCGLERFLESGRSDRPHTMTREVEESVRAFFALLQSLSTPQFDHIEDARMRGQARRESAELIAKAYENVYRVYAGTGAGHGDGNGEQRWQEEDTRWFLPPPQVRSLLDG